MTCVAPAFGARRPTGSTASLRTLSSTLWHAPEGLFDHHVGTALQRPRWPAVMVALVVVVFLRWPLSYGVFMAVVIAPSVTSTNPRPSLERYGLFGAPGLVLALADLTEHRLVERIVFVVLPVTLFAYALLAFSGLYVLLDAGTGSQGRVERGSPRAGQHGRRCSSGSGPVW